MGGDAHVVVRETAKEAGWLTSESGQVGIFQIFSFSCTFLLLTVLKIDLGASEKSEDFQGARYKYIDQLSNWTFGLIKNGFEFKIC